MISQRLQLQYLGLGVMLLNLILTVNAHTEDAKSGFGLIEFFAVIAVVSIIVATALLLLRRFETVPGSLPIKKLAIAAAITIIINSLLLGYIYREALL